MGERWEARNKEWSGMGAKEKTGAILGVVMGVLVVAFIVSLIASGGDKNKPSADSVTPVSTEKQSTEADKAAAAKRAAAKAAAQAKQKRTDTIDAVAPVFCQNHTNKLMENIEYLRKDGWPVHEGRRAWTAEECRTIIGKLYDNGSDKELLDLVALAKIRIGMSETELIYSWGAPNDLNKSNYGYGEEDQFIYGGFGYDHTQYVYLEDGTITSWQDM